MDVTAPAGLATRVLVVDDSAIVRGLIARYLGADAKIEVVATAANGEIALSEIRRKPVDVVVLDIEMPVMDGMTALGLIVRDFPDIKVIMVSTLTHRNAEITLKAMQMGAADYIPKPETGLAGAEAFKLELVSKVKALGPRRVRPAARLEPVAPRPAAPVAAAPASSATRTRPTLLAIGASTGGPPALMKLFEALRGRIEQPILLTQHMPPTFTALLAEQIGKIGERPCTEARDGEPVRPGHCYVAPGDFHMTVAREGTVATIRLNQEPKEHFCRPAVDPMLRSVAQTYGAGALVVILTGMGTDGAKGCEVVARSGGRFIAQDEPSSVVWGMPGAAAATGLAEAVLPLGQVGPWICRVMGAGV